MNTIIQDPNSNVIAEKPIIPIRYIIHRFETNTPISPDYIIVGFKLICDSNRREIYHETTVAYSDCIDKNDNEICLMAYDKLKSKFEQSTTELLKSERFLIGSEFVPPL